MFYRLRFWIKFSRLFIMTLWYGLKIIYRMRGAEQANSFRNSIRAMAALNHNINENVIPKAEPERARPEPGPEDHDELCSKLGLNYNGQIPYRLNVKFLSDGCPIVGGYSVPDEVYEEVVHNLMESSSERIVVEFGHHFIWNSNCQGWNALHRHSELGIE